MVGIEQEYTVRRQPASGWPDRGVPAPQGGYYCGVGSDEVFGRELVEAHAEACLRSGIAIVGTNAEVMPAQWEFQIGALPPLEMADELWLARWLLYRIGEEYGISATLHPKPIKGDWNGAGAHTNFSTKQSRSEGGMKFIEAAVKKLEKRHAEHMEVYGAFNEERLTADTRHATSISSAAASATGERRSGFRWPLADGKGYFEDRRPAANMDPYQVARFWSDRLRSLSPPIVILRSALCDEGSQDATL